MIRESEALTLRESRSLDTVLHSLYDCFIYSAGDSQIDLLDSKGWLEALGRCGGFVGAHEVSLAVGDRDSCWRREKTHKPTSSEKLWPCALNPDIDIERALGVIEGTVRFRFKPRSGHDTEDCLGRLDQVVAHLTRILLMRESLRKVHWSNYVSRRIFDRMDTATCVVDSERHIILINDKARSIIACSKTLSIDEGARLHCCERLLQEALEDTIRVVLEKKGNLAPTSRLVLDSDENCPLIVEFTMEARGSHFDRNDQIDYVKLSIFDPTSTRKLPLERLSLLYKLSPAESEVFRLIVAGQTNRQIASARHVSNETVRTQASSIFNKLGVKRRTELFTLLSAMLST